MPPPPPIVAESSEGAGQPEPKREISKSERKDYEGAIAYFEKSDKEGSWSESDCRSSADRFSSVVRSHPQMVEAQYMVGLSYQRCNLAADAERAYQAALKIKSNHGQSLSNLGELYYRAGKVEGARQYWESAVKANGKLIAARINIASMELEQMRKLVPHSPEWKKLEEDARFQLSNVLGVDSDSHQAYTVYGLVYLEGFEKNRNRLDLDKLLLDEGKKRLEKYAPLENAYGLYYMNRNALSEALRHFQAAVELDPKFVESASLSEIECSPAARARYLAPWHDRPGAVLCLCRSEGVPMGVARRQAPRLTYYLYPLHRADPSRHALACPHGLRGAMREEGDRPNERAGVVQSIGGRIRVNLAAPIFQRPSVLKASAPGNVEEDPSPNEESPPANELRARPLKGTLLTLLQLLWTEAELNTWRPGFAGRRHCGDTELGAWIARHRPDIMRGSNCTR